MKRKASVLAALTTALLVAFGGVAWAALSNQADPGTVNVDGQVLTILEVGNRVYLGGDFTHVDGVPRSHLAAVDATTGALTGWDPNAGGSNPSVRALASSPDGSRIYAGGAFTSIGGTSRGRLAAIDASTGALVTAWNPGSANDTVRAIAVSGNRVYVGGSFTSLQGQSRTRLALLDGTTGVLDPNWSPAADNVVRSLRLSADASRLYIGGGFANVSGRSRPYLASLDANTGSLDTTFSPPSPNGMVLALASSGGRVYTAEAGIGGQAAAYDTTTGTRAWRYSADGDVQGVSVLAGEVYLAGHFDSFAGQARKVFAAVDASTGALNQQWTPTADPSYPGVWVLSTSGAFPRIYAGGDFTRVTGQPHLRFAQFTDSSSPGTSVDTTPPETTITSGPPAASNSTSASFSFSSTESGSTFECSLDGVAFSSCTSPQNYSGLADGRHTFAVRATDAAGNTDVTPASRSWTVDTLAPNAPVILAPAENSTMPASFTLSGTTEAGTTVEIFDGTLSLGTTQADASGAWSRALSNISGGSHTYTARATDAAGNTSGASNLRTVTVDATIPETTITSGASGTVSSRDATFEFSSTEPGTFGCSLDGGPYSACTSPRTYTALSNGSHTFQVRATDTSGNTDPTPASRTWKVQLSGKTK
jgi:hypothetical protein